MNPPTNHRKPQWHILAPTLTWIIPGLGHWIIGQRRRGIILMVTIPSLWISGLLIGGLGSCNRDRNPAWFMAQSLFAPSILVNHYQSKNTAYPLGKYEDPDLNAWKVEPSFGHANEQGILYTALAGLLNLFCTLDIIHRDSSVPQNQPTTTTVKT
jgi:hypothetical protein